VPELFSIHERHCRALGIEPPELYASAVEHVGISTSLAIGRRRVVVLGPELFAGLEAIRERRDVFEFVLAYELGRLELGHATWWDALLLGYLKRIPVLRMPLLRVQTASRDRFAATLAPAATLRGLALVAVGGDLLDHVDTRAFVRDVLRDDTPRWSIWLGGVGRDAPHLALRVRELHRSGFLDLERHLAPEAVEAEAPSAEPVDERHHPPLHH
jgi:hypothetical protein